MTGTLKGGLGSASCVLPSGITVGALVAVNALGSATVGETPHFWAAPWEEGAEFGGLGPAPQHAATTRPCRASGMGEATTIAIVATDAALTKAQAQRMAVAAHDGMARALVPSHTPLDGDLVFSVATGARADGRPADRQLPARPRRRDLPGPRHRTGGLLPGAGRCPGDPCRPTLATSRFGGQRVNGTPLNARSASH